MVLDAVLQITSPTKISLINSIFEHIELQEGYAIDREDKKDSKIFEVYLVNGQGNKRREMSLNGLYNTILHSERQCYRAGRFLTFSKVPEPTYA